jgi:cytoskeleton protein RodZ
MNTPSDSEAAVLLREGRLAMELELDAACLATRIPAEQIKALEEGRYADLPGPAYARAFARTLAQAYGIDSELVVAAVRRDLGEKPDESAAKRAAVPAATTRIRTTPVPPEAPGGTKGKSRGPLVLVVLLGAALVALIGLTRLRGGPSVPEPFPASATDSLADSAGASATDTLPTDSVTPAAVAPPVRTVTFAVRDSARSAFLLYIRAGRVRKATLQGLDSLVLDPDTSALFRNLSTYALRLSGAVRADSLDRPYFRVERRGDSVRVVVSDEDAWKVSYDQIMAKRASREKKKESR